MTETTGTTEKAKERELTCARCGQNWTRPAGTKGRPGYCNLEGCELGEGGYGSRSRKAAEQAETPSQEIPTETIPVAEEQVEEQPQATPKVKAPKLKTDDLQEITLQLPEHMAEVVSEDVIKLVQGALKLGSMGHDVLIRVKGDEGHLANAQVGIVESEEEGEITSRVVPQGEAFLDAVLSLGS